MKIIRVNMDELSIKTENVQEKYKLLGGRGFIASFALDEIPPMCSPIGPENKLIFCIGPLAGTNLTSSARLSAGGKSPLTGGIKESNAGGTVARDMAKLGIKAIIIEGKPQNKDLYIIHFNKDLIKITPAEEYRGMGTYEFTERIKSKYGKDNSLVCIGPAGEQIMTAAGILVTDTNGFPSRACGRGGLGALMGSKGIKGLIFDGNGDNKVTAVDEVLFKKTVRDFHKTIRENPQTSETYTKYGTVAALTALNELGGLPTKNFRSGSTKHASKLSSEYLRNLILERSGEGKTTHNCMPGCIVQCSNVFPDKHGQAIVGPVEFEGAAMLGSNIDIDDYDDIAQLTWLCNDIGVDLIEIGAVFSMLLDEGIIAPFGDKELIEKFLNEIRQGTITGKVLGQGVCGVAKVFGIERVMAVKGQSFAGHDPRGVKGMAFTYAFTPMGADHTAAVTVRSPIDHHSPVGQMEVSRNLQVTVAAYDTLGVCYFVCPAVGNKPEFVRDLLNSLYGTEYCENIVEMLGKFTILSEKRFNQLAGFTSADDRLPDAVFKEKLPPYNLVVDISQEDFGRYWEKEYWGSLKEIQKYLEHRRREQ